MSADARQVALDWITIWQSELTAAAYDRELQEAWVCAADRWAQGAALAAGFLPAGDDTHRRPGAGPQAGAAAAAPASDARDAALARLAARVAELERLVAGLTPPAG